MSPCPTEEALRAFLSGAVTAAEGESVGQHLSGCPECLRKLDAIGDTPDPLVGALRGAVPASTWAEPAVLELLGLAPVGGAGHVGERVGPYRLLGKLGEGGMGTVYKARHEKLGKVFALKVLPPGRHGDPARTTRFEREFLAVGRLEHPHIVRATDAGEHDGVLFLAMELVDGIDLARLVRRHGPLRVADACEVARQAALALRHAHERGLIHRDVKPSNLLLTPDGTVKLLDLGLALAVEDPDPPAPVAADAPTETPGLTLTGLALGTRDYMAPEQAADPHGVDPRADIYGLGATLHFLVTGKPPGGPQAPPAALADVLGRMLARRPEERFATAAEVAAAVGRRARGHDLPALAAGTPARFGGRSRVVDAAIGAVGLAVAVLGVLVAVPRPGGTAGATSPEQSPPPDPPPPAVTQPPVATPPASAGPLPVAPRPRPARRGPAPTGGWQMTAAEAAALQRRWADYLGEEVVIENVVGMKLALIPPIPSNKGTSPAVPIRRPYRMGVHEVTRGQFRRFVEATGYKTDAETGGGALVVVGLATVRNPAATWLGPRAKNLTDDHPITYVSWRDAMAFCKWLGERDGRRYRVPTAAEWWSACRAGSVSGYHGYTTDDQFLLTIAWYARNSPGGPQPVGRLKANPFGLYDMIGNVGEWVMDRVGPSPPDYRPEEDTTEEVFRMLRGGSFQDPAGVANLTNTTRTDLGGLASIIGAEWNGFRVHCDQD